MTTYSVLNFTLKNDIKKCITKKTDVLEVNLKQKLERQKRLESLSLLTIESYLKRMLDFNSIVHEFVIKDSLCI